MMANTCDDIHQVKACKDGNLSGEIPSPSISLFSTHRKRAGDWWPPSPALALALWIGKGGSNHAGPVGSLFVRLVHANWPNRANLVAIQSDQQEEGCLRIMQIKTPNQVVLVLPAFRPSFRPSVLPACLPACLPSFLPSFHKHTEFECASDTAQAT